MVNLKHRSAEPEIMDDLELPAAELDPVLKGLGQVNKLFGSYSSIIKALKQFPVEDGNSIADWGCGGGDTLVAIAKWSQKTNINLKLTGIDAAPAAIRFAQQNIAAYQNISFIRADVLNTHFTGNSADVIITSLFTHHFADADWVRLIQNMYNTCRRGIIITDLHRHWLLYYAVIFITNVFTRNKMVRVDGPLSVKRSFKKQELKMLLNAAGIKSYTLKWLWAFRWQIVVHKL